MGGNLRGLQLFERSRQSLNLSQGEV